MTCISSIPNQIISILCLLLAEISMKFHSKSTSLRNMTCNSSIPNHYFMNFCLFLLKIVWNFIQKISIWEIWHIPLHFQIRISRFCVYCELKLCMNFHSKDTSCRNMTCNSSIPNQIISILCLLLAEISMKFHSKSTSLRNMTCNSSIRNHDFMNFCLFLLKLSMKFHSTDTSLRIMMETTLIPNHNLSIWCLFWP